MKKVVDITEAVFLNGITTIPASPSTVLVADSFLRVVYSVDTKTGAYAAALDEPAFKPLASAAFLLGINGIRVSSDGHYIYFTNSFRAPLLGRMPITSKGTAAGSVETIAAAA